jgi:hypothetical protein
VPPFLAISRFSDVFGKFAVSAGDIQHHPPDWIAEAIRK